jgi:hypothetical protein
MIVANVWTGIANLPFGFERFLDNESFVDRLICCGECAFHHIIDPVLCFVIAQSVKIFDKLFHSIVRLLNHPIDHLSVLITKALSRFAHDESDLIDDETVNAILVAFEKHWDCAEITLLFVCARVIVKYGNLESFWICTTMRVCVTSIPQISHCFPFRQSQRSGSPSGGKMTLESLLISIRSSRFLISKLSLPADSAFRRFSSC